MTAKSKAGDGLGPGTGIGNGNGAGPALEPRQKATGQRSSKERGAHTRSKKNPGKRPRQGGSSA